MQNLRYILCLLVCLIGNTSSAQTLNILTWEAQLADTTISQWEARSGVAVKLIYFDQEEVRNTILLSSDTNDIDIVTIDPVTAGLIGQRNVFLPVAQYQNTPNIRHADPSWAQGCAPYATPFLWGTLGIVYRKDRVSPAPTSWRDIMQPHPELQGHIGWVENYLETLAPSLFLRNQAISTDDEALLKEVFDEMQSLLPSILTFEYSISYIGEQPDSDDLYMALAYSGDQQELNKLSQSQQWNYVVPEEGSMIWSECLAILGHSEKQQLALDFINFINIPEVAAANSEAAQIATSNVPAAAMQSAEFRNNPIYTPTQEQRAKLIHYDPDLSVRNILLRDRITSTLVELHESQ